MGAEIVGADASATIPEREFAAYKDAFAQYKVLVFRDQHLSKDQLIVFKPGAEIVLKASGAARLMIMGGEPLPEQRHIFWNFVSSSKERIEQASRDWRERRFPGVPGETEFIPLPDTPVFRAS